MILDLGPWCWLTLSLTSAIDYNGAGIQGYMIENVVDLSSAIKRLSYHRTKYPTEMGLTVS